MTISFYYSLKLLKLLHKAIDVSIFPDLVLVFLDLAFLFSSFIYFTRKISPTQSCAVQRITSGARGSCL